MMKQEKAAEIHRHLQAAVRAMRRTEHILWDQDQETRAEFGEHYPKLPQRCILGINTKLRWNQGRLPPGMTEADVDAIIFSVMKSRWAKVAYGPYKSARALRGALLVYRL